MPEPRRRRTDPLPIDPDVVRRMRKEGRRPHEIASHFGVTSKQLWDWSYHHRVAYDSEAPDVEAPVKRYFVCRECGDRSEQYPDQEALQRHREAVHGVQQQEMGLSLRQAIEQTRADADRQEKELEAMRADLRVLEEAQRVLERLAKGGAA